MDFDRLLLLDEFLGQFESFDSELFKFLLLLFKRFLVEGLELVVLVDSLVLGGQLSLQLCDLVGFLFHMFFKDIHWRFLGQVLKLRFTHRCVVIGCKW